MSTRAIPHATDPKQTNAHAASVPRAAVPKLGSPTVPTQSVFVEVEKVDKAARQDWSISDVFKRLRDAIASFFRWLCCCGEQKIVTQDMHQHADKDVELSPPANKESVHQPSPPQLLPQTAPTPTASPVVKQTPVAAVVPPIPTVLNPVQAPVARPVPTVPSPVPVARPDLQPSVPTPPVSIPCVAPMQQLPHQEGAEEEESQFVFFPEIAVHPSDGPQAPDRPQDAAQRQKAIDSLAARAKSGDRKDSKESRLTPTEQRLARSAHLRGSGSSRLHIKANATQALLSGNFDPAPAPAAAASAVQASKTSAQQSAALANSWEKRRKLLLDMIAFQANFKAIEEIGGLNDPGILETFLSGIPEAFKKWLRVLKVLGVEGTTKFIEKAVNTLEVASHLEVLLDEQASPQEKHSAFKEIKDQVVK